MAAPGDVMSAGGAGCASAQYGQISTSTSTRIRIAGGNCWSRKRKVPTPFDTVVPPQSVPQAVNRTAASFSISASTATSTVALFFWKNAEVAGGCRATRRFTAPSASLPAPDPA